MGSEAIPRLTYAQLPESLATLLAPRVKRLGYLGEFFQVAAHLPDALNGFVQFTEGAKAGLDKRLVELLALTVARLTGNVYESNQHERLSVRLGYGREWVAQVQRLEPEAADQLTPRERLLQRFAIDGAPSHGRVGQKQFEAIAAEFGYSAAMAALMVISRYLAHAYIVNTLSLAPPVPSIWADGFDESSVQP